MADLRQPSLSFARVVRLSVTSIAGCLLAAGCAPSSVPTDIYGSIEKCGLEGNMRLEPQGQNRFRIAHLDPDTDYEKLDCFIREAQRLRVDLGFVGNEAFAR